MVKEVAGVGLGLAVGKSFDLEKAVCNHGFFMMAPNRWDKSTKTLERPLRLFNSPSSVTVSISQPQPHPHSLSLLVHSSHLSLSSQDHEAILEQVRRMLRLSEKEEKEIEEFQRLHLEARKRGFGRLFRSPCLFEDVVKSILLCNTTFARSLKMAGELCKIQKQLKEHKVGLKRKRSSSSRGRRIISIHQKEKSKESMGANESDYEEWGDFPNAQELAALDEDNLLIKQCNLGKLEKIKGMGPFACANVFMCIGLYHKVPRDSETIRHLKQVHGRENCNKKTVNAIVEEVYDMYAPFQCLAYWLEMLEYYESRVGNLSELERSSYGSVAGSCFGMSRRGTTN